MEEEEEEEETEETEPEDDFSQSWDQSSGRFQRHPAQAYSTDEDEEEDSPRPTVEPRFETKRQATTTTGWLLTEREDEDESDPDLEADPLKSFRQKSTALERSTDGTKNKRQRFNATGTHSQTTTTKKES